MRINVDIAGGYKKSKIAQLVHDNPGMTIEQVTARFIADQYEPWIISNLSENYSILNVTADNFSINFDNDDEAKVFTEQIGGRP